MYISIHTRTLCNCSFWYMTYKHPSERHADPIKLPENAAWENGDQVFVLSRTITIWPSDSINSRFFWRTKHFEFLAKFEHLRHIFVDDKTGSIPTDPFTILDLQIPSHDDPELLHRIRQSPDLDVLNNVKGPVGILFLCSTIFQFTRKQNERWSVTFPNVIRKMCF